MAISDDDVKMIKREVHLELNAIGHEASQKAIEDITRAVVDLIEKHKGVIGSNADLRSSINKTARDYNSRMGQMSRSTYNLKTQMKQIGNIASKLAIGVTFRSGWSELEKYANVMVRASTYSRRFGISSRELESVINRLSYSTRLLKSDVVELFDAWQRKIVFPSLSGFEKMSSRISDIVGTNKSDMGEMMNVLTSLIDKYPEFQSALENASKGDNRALQSRLRSLFILGQIGQEEYRMVQTYLSGAKHRSAADLKHERNLREQQRLYQDLRKYTNDIALAIGKALLPVMKEVAGLANEYGPQITQFLESVPDRIQSLIDKMKSLGVTAKQVLVAFLAFKAIPPIMSAIGTVTNALSMGGGIGGMGKGRMGKIGGLGGLVAGRLGVAGGAAVGSYSLGQMANSYSDEDGLKKAAAGAGSVLASAFSGAMIGSFGGPVGMAIGGVAGAAMALYALDNPYEKELGKTVDKNLYKDYQADKSGIRKAFTYTADGSTTLLEKLGFMISQAWESRKFNKGNAEVAAMQESQKKRNKALQIEQYQSRSNYSDFLEETRQVTVAPHIDFQGDMQGSLKTIEDNRKLVDKLEKEVRDRTNFLNTRDAGIFDERYGGHLTIGSRDGLQKLQDNLRGKLSTASKQDAAGIQADIDKLSEYLEKIDKAADEKGADLRAISAELEKQKNIQALLESSLNKETVRQSKILELLNAQRGVLDGILSLYGQDLGMTWATASDGIETYRKSIVATIDSMDKFMEIMQGQNPADLFTPEQLAANGQITGEAKKIWDDVLKTHGIDPSMNISQADYQKVFAEYQAKRIALSSQQLEISNLILAADERRLQLLSQESQLMQSMISLADNYAIGIGASVQMRLGGVAAIQNEIQELQTMLDKQKEELAINPQNADARRNILDLQTRIVAKQTEQANLTKTMRDGWVSAISAMNTGAGRFSKIILDQNQNTAQALQLGGAVSNISGSIKGGYTSSARWGTHGGLVGSQRQRGSTNTSDAFAYETTMDNMLRESGMDPTSVISETLRNNNTEAIEAFTNQQRVLQEGFDAVGASIANIGNHLSLFIGNGQGGTRAEVTPNNTAQENGNRPNRPGEIVPNNSPQGSNGRSGISIVVDGIHIDFKDLDKLGSSISKKIMALVEEYFNMLPSGGASKAGMDTGRSGY